jgi:hypothetical protein
MDNKADDGLKYIIIEEGGERPDPLFEVQIFLDVFLSFFSASLSTL